MRAVRVRRLVAVGVASVLILIVLTGILGLVRAAGTPGPSVTVSVQLGADQNTIRLGPAELMANPTTAVGPDPTNLSREDVYVLGLGNTGITSCQPLVSFRSMNGGATFSGPLNSSFCLTGSQVAAIVLPSGDLVVATPGPTVLLSIDGGETWTLVATLGTGGSAPSLARDNATGALSLAWSEGTPSTLLYSSSTDGGAAWAPPRAIAPSQFDVRSAQVAAEGGTVIVTFLNGTGAAATDSIDVIASTTDGVAWSPPEIVVPVDPSVELSPPSITASSTGEFAIVWYDEATGAFPGSIEFSTGSGAGNTWGPPIAAAPSGPPLGAPNAAPQVATFDSYGRLFVTWHNYSAVNPLLATLNVAGSDRTLQSFATSSFNLAYHNSAYNGTQGENLVADRTGHVFLSWAVYGAYQNTSFGIFVRTVTGAVTGSAVHTVPSGTQLTIADSAVAGSYVYNTTWTGNSISVPELPPDEYVVTISVPSLPAVATSIPIEPFAETAITVTFAAAPTGGAPGPSLAPTLWVALAGLGAGTVIVAILTSTLYTRLRRETVLQQKVRLLMHEFVAAHPGASFREVRNALGLQNGVTAYHLDVLERQGILHSERRGRRRFFFSEGDPSLWAGAIVTPLQRAILDAIRTNPGISVREIGRSIGRVPASVSYNLRLLVRQGLLRTERRGARLLCFLGKPSVE